MKSLSKCEIAHIVGITTTTLRRDINSSPLKERLVSAGYKNQRVFRGASLKIICEYYCIYETES